MTYIIQKENGTPTIMCTLCGMKSYNNKDVEERYCASCHTFHGEGIVYTIPILEEDEGIVTFVCMYCGPVRRMTLGGGMETVQDPPGDHRHIGLYTVEGIEGQIMPHTHLWFDRELARDLIDDDREPYWWPKDW